FPIRRHRAVTSPSAEPRAVSRFEADLLHLLYFFLRRLPREQGVPLLMARCERPRCLSRAAVELVQDALAKGCTVLLARAGGWRRERHLRQDRTVEGRLWERTPPGELGLSFSGHSLDFLMWATAAKVTDSKQAWQPPEEGWTTGDLLLLY